MRHLIGSQWSSCKVLEMLIRPRSCDKISDRALQTSKPINILNRDPHQGRVGVIEATADERTANVLGAVQCEIETDVAGSTNVIETGF